MIWEGPMWAQVLKTVLAVVFIGTFLWKIIKKDWWWNSFKK